MYVELELISNGLETVGRMWMGIEFVTCHKYWFFYFILWKRSKGNLWKGTFFAYFYKPYLLIDYIKDDDDALLNKISVIRFGRFLSFHEVNLKDMIRLCAIKIQSATAVIFN